MDLPIHPSTMVEWDIDPEEVETDTDDGNHWYPRTPEHEALMDELFPNQESDDKPF